ncbi:MAG: Fic family protein [Kiritimatiellales bacterium]|nr:Fic family protein [Kiritimatiellales bacterium]
MKSSSSCLAPFIAQIRELRKQGVPLRKIAETLNREHGLSVTYNAVFSFLKTQEKSDRRPTLFYENLPADIQKSLIQQFAALWTHESTAIEGNTLTLGETVKVLELGLTISGKSLKDHEEVYGHAKAIELIYNLMNAEIITATDLFNLHRCVMQKSAIDSLRPVGNWKRDFNGTTGVRDGKPVYMEYAKPDDTSGLMIRWIKEFNRKMNTATSSAKAVNVYAWAHLSFVRIHPFFDGNGRVARLIANLPLLKGGQPPLLISPERRSEYIDLLWNYQNAVGVIQRNDRLLPPHPTIPAFKSFLRDEWKESLRLIENARKLAAQRSLNP